MKINSSIKVLLIVFLLVACVPATNPAEIATPSETSTPTPSVYGLLFSPDGMMRIQSHDWKTYEIIADDGKILWSFTYDADKYEKFGVHPGLPIFTEAGWYPVYWSEDRRCIYMSVVHGGEGGSTKFFGNAFTDGAGLFKFDIEIGELTEIVPEIYPGYYAFAISPDGNQLVYANQTEKPVKIKLLDLKNFNERLLVTADEKVLEMGSFGWSPSMDEIIFTTLEMPDDENDNYSIFMLYLKSLKTQVLVSGINKWLGLESWDEQGRILYRDTYRAVWELNLESKILMPLAVPTLTLAP